VTDPRPINCRFRLVDEGKAYPRSSCTGCGRTITTGLGRSCHHVATITADVDELVQVIYRELRRQSEKDDDLAPCLGDHYDPTEQLLNGNWNIRDLAQAILKSGVTDR
jgi:hypothetical protein